MNPRWKNWSGRKVWLVGASSGIGAALARELALLGASLVLSARRPDKLLGLGLTQAWCLPCDVTQVDSVNQAYAEISARWEQIDLVVYLAGDYVPMHADQFDLLTAERLMAVNFMGALNLSAAVLPGLKPGNGMAFVASVAGYRGLPKALAYGPGKAALIHFAEGLYLDLTPKGVGVWLVNPGFVETPLTAQNDFKMPALITAEQAARAMISGFASGRFEIHFPQRFTLVLKVMSLMPYALYFWLVRRITRE